MASIRRTRVIASVIIVSAAVVALLALGISFVWIFQERIAFQPPGKPWPDDSGTRRLEYSASDGQRLTGYLIGDSVPANGLLLVFHGNADLAAWQIDWAEEVARRSRITVMLAEYRGYMGLDGRPGYRQSQLDAEAAYRFARDKLKTPAGRIAFFGHSLGSAIATELAVQHPPAALLLQSPFTSARDMAGRITGYQPSKFLWQIISRLHFDTQARLAEIGAPVSVSHGGSDRLIPLRMGEKVFAAARVKGAWLLVPDAAHNDVALRGGEAYWSWILEGLVPLRN